MESASEARERSPLSSLHLLYHELRIRGSEYSYIVDADEFASHLDLFVQIREATSGLFSPEVTFDDGHSSDFEQALPILQARGLSARFFITVGWTGKRPGYMGWPELRSLQESGQQIGAHGWSHTLLTHCTPKALDKELISARLILEDKLGTQITTMSLPGGRYNRRVLTACHQAGYTHIYTSAPRIEPMPLGFTVGRLNIRGDMTLGWIRNVLEPGSDALARLERQHRIKQGVKLLLGDRLYERLWALLNRQEPGNGDSEYNAE